MKFVRKLQRELMKARIDKGLSQKELAELVDTTQSVISRLESSDDPNPNLSTIFKISKALDKTLDISFV